MVLENVKIWSETSRKGGAAALGQYIGKMFSVEITLSSLSQTLPLLPPRTTPICSLLVHFCAVVLYQPNTTLPGKKDTFGCSPCK